MIKGTGKFILFFLALFFGCAKGRVSPADYVLWVEDKANGLRVEKEVGDFIFSLQYNPLEYLALHQISSKGISKEAFEEKKNGIDETIDYYTLQLRAKDSDEELLKYKIRGEKEYYERLEYFSFSMQNDLSLIDGTDTLIPVFHHFERIYGIAPYSNIVIGFKRGAGNSDSESAAKSATKNKTLVYQDRILGTGTIKLLIRGEDLQKVPHLIIK